MPLEQKLTEEEMNKILRALYTEVEILGAFDTDNFAIRQNEYDIRNFSNYRQFFIKYLNSRYILNEDGKLREIPEIIEELIELVKGPLSGSHSINPSKFTKILKRGEAKDLYEIFECASIESPYEIVCKLGRGAAGITYKVYSPELNKYRALKIIYDKFSRKEGELMAKLESKDLDNIVQIYEAGKRIVRVHNAKEYAIVMEYVDGKTISELCQERKLSLDKILDYSAQIFNGILSLRINGITHRDLNPNNIKVNSSGTVKILDFGIATDKPNPKGKDAPRFGVPSSMDASDIYSLGLIIYQLSTGKHLIIEKTGSMGSRTQRELITEEKEKLYENGELRQKYRDRIKQNIPLGIMPLIFGCLGSKDINYLQQAFVVTRADLKYYFMNKEELIKRIKNLEQSKG